MLGLAQLLYSPLPVHSQNQNRYFSGVTHRFSDNSFTKSLSFKPLSTSHVGSKQRDFALHLKYRVPPCPGGADGGSIGMGRGNSGDGDGGNSWSWSGKGNSDDSSKSWWDSLRSIGAFVMLLLLGLVGVSVLVIGWNFLFSMLVYCCILSLLMAPESLVLVELWPQILAVTQQAISLSLSLVVYSELAQLLTKGFCLLLLLDLLVLLQIIIIFICSI